MRRYKQLMELKQGKDIKYGTVPRAYQCVENTTSFRSDKVLGGGNSEAESASEVLPFKEKFAHSILHTLVLTNCPKGLLR